MKEKLTRFIYGRYGGNDALNKFLMWACFILLFAGIFVRLPILSYAAIILAGYNLFRALSKNIQKRQRENALFLKCKSRVTRPFREKRDKEHAYRTCPHCKARLRLPRKKGKHTVCCPKCGKDFEVRI